MEWSSLNIKPLIHSVAKVKNNIICWHGTKLAFHGTIKKKTLTSLHLKWGEFKQAIYVLLWFALQLKGSVIIQTFMIIL